MSTRTWIALVGALLVGLLWWVADDLDGLPGYSSVLRIGHGDGRLEVALQPGGFTAATVELAPPPPRRNRQGGGISVR